MSATIDTWIGRFGLLAGVLVVAAWLAIAGRPGDAPAPTASIRLGTLVNGELDISPAQKPVLAGTSLEPGEDSERGTLTVRNQTPRRLSFALRTSAVQRELDRAAWIEVADGDRALVRAPLGSTRGWSRKRLDLSSGEARNLDVRVWLPDDAPDGWQAARADVTLEFTSTPRRTR